MGSRKPLECLMALSTYKTLKNIKVFGLGAGVHGPWGPTLKNLKLQVRKWTLTAGEQMDPSKVLWYLHSSHEVAWETCQQLVPGSGSQVLRIADWSLLE